MNIRIVTPDDAQAIANIYNEYIENSIITFETACVGSEEMSMRISQALSSGLAWFVAESDDGSVLGYAYASKWKGRCAYAHSVEVTVYVSSVAHGQGLGTLLYQALFEQLRVDNYHVAIAGISLPNDASIALHEKFGMKKVAHFAEVGFKFERWIDVGYWQVIL
ncbi:arsinothricin resistance N-acetyltransferase ArsN1 family B [Thalassotalea fusca]